MQTLHQLRESPRAYQLVIQVSQSSYNHGYTATLGGINAYELYRDVDHVDPS